MAKPRTMFMHTINGKPASYEPGDQIAFAPRGRYARKGIRLVASIAQIRAEQRATIKYRTAQGWDSNGFEYSYVRVEISE